ncbi:MAG: hypothetical protein H6523_13330 [Mycolicibacterium sp.]|nr:hypothetical protein [Mycolicibacterium sp.]
MTADRGTNRLREARHMTGWHGIMARLADELDSLSSEVTIHDYKEKYGTLRVSVSVSDPELRDEAERLVDAAEDASEVTCMHCGSPGERDDSWHWVLTLCQSCSNKRTEERVTADLAARRRTRWPRPMVGHATGWATILAELKRDLERVDPELFVMRLDTSNGSLRIQFWASHHELRGAVQARIDEAAAAADVICARCGAPGEKRPVGKRFTQPYCDACQHLRDFFSDNRLWRSEGRSVEDFAMWERRWTPTSPVLLQLPDGQLAAAGYPDEEQVVAVRNGTELGWARVEETGADALGGAVPAVIIKAQHPDA